MRYQVFFRFGLLGSLALGPLGQVVAQSNATITDLRTPSSPGFVLLGVEPTSIEKPTTPSGFATSLQSAVTATGVRPGYSLEVAPYWLKNRPIQIDEYQNPGLVQNLRQSYSFSLATSSLGAASGTGAGTGVGIGGRVQLFSGKVSTTKNAELALTRCKGVRVKDAVLARIDAVITDETAGITDSAIEVHKDDLVSFAANAIQASMARSHAAIVANIKQNACKALSDREIEEAIESFTKAAIYNLRVQYAKPIATRADLAAWHDSYRDAVEQDPAVSKMLADALSLDKDRTGFVWDVAAATLLAFPQSTWENARLQRWGLWTTLGYAEGDFDLLVCGRIISPISMPDSARSYDIGFKFNWGSGNFKLGAEALFRQYRRSQDIPTGGGFVESRTVHKNTERYAVNLHYKFSEMIAITSTIGKNFDAASVAGNNLLTIFGVEYNLPYAKP
jgi:hypothetical protein